MPDMAPGPALGQMSAVRQEGAQTLGHFQTPLKFQLAKVLFQVTTPTRGAG